MPLACFIRAVSQGHPNKKSQTGACSDLLITLLPHPALGSPSAELGNGHDLGSIRCRILVLLIKLKHATGMFHQGRISGASK